MFFTTPSSAILRSRLKPWAVALEGSHEVELRKMGVGGMELAVWGAKKLKRRGVRLVAPPESFFVTKTKVPALEPGELERAAVWATTVTAGV